MYGNREDPGEGGRKETNKRRVTNMKYFSIFRFGVVRCLTGIRIIQTN